MINFFVNVIMSCGIKETSKKIRCRNENILVKKDLCVNIKVVDVSRMYKES